MSSGKAPSAGQKVSSASASDGTVQRPAKSPTQVTPGDSGPVYQEGTGFVQDSSLAAESKRSGGAFSENRGGNVGEQHHVLSRGSDSGGSAGVEAQQSYGGQAPSYVQSQYHRDPNGPHGKNLQEGGFEGSGPGDSILAEPGSKQDPGRAAEHDLKLSQAKTGRDAGPRQGGLEGEHPYQVLDSERST